MANAAGWSDQLTQLNETLADLYPTVDDSRRVVTLAGLPARSIRFSEAAGINWFNILGAALLRGRVRALVNIALVDFPENAVLSAAAQPEISAATASVGPAGRETIAPPAQDLAYEPMLRMTQVATSIHHLLTAAEAPLVTCLVGNPGPRSRRVRFKTRIERLSDPAVDLVSIPAGGEHDGCARVNAG